MDNQDIFIKKSSKPNTLRVKTNQFSNDLMNENNQNNLLVSFTEQGVNEALFDINYVLD